mgnify:FL=1|tara:strand:+ start:213 stop:656 length:444 start_codon:yes stop_codon:yes gene_type:complete
MSNLLVQTIKHTNNTSAQTIDTSGRTTAVLNNDTTYRSDNGAVTQNMVQGLAKQWFNNSSGASPRDSFNVSGITDNQTGDDTYSYTNNMNDANHAVVPAGWRDHDHYHAANETMLSTSSSRVRAYVRGGNSTVDSAFKCCAVFGDLA